ncbi:MAG: JAB domain-containing protein [Acidimicrobiales bacterium]
MRRREPVTTYRRGGRGFDRSLAFSNDGRSFALAHNHPSGDPEPSESDRKATVEVAAGATMVGLRFLSHVVVAGQRWQVVSPDQQRLH